MKRKFILKMRINDLTANNSSIHVFSLLVAQTVDSGASDAKVDSKGMHAVKNCNI